MILLKSAVKLILFYSIANGITNVVGYNSIRFKKIDFKWENAIQMVNVLLDFISSFRVPCPYLRTNIVMDFNAY